MFTSSDSLSCHEFATQFGLTWKILEFYNQNSRPWMYWNFSKGLGKILQYEPVFGVYLRSAMVKVEELASLTKEIVKLCEYLQNK